MKSRCWPGIQISFTSFLIGVVFGANDELRDALELDESDLGDASQWELGVFYNKNKQRVAGGELGWPRDVIKRYSNPVYMTSAKGELYHKVDFAKEITKTNVCLAFSLSVLFIEINHQVQMTTTETLHSKTDKMRFSYEVSGQISMLHGDLMELGFMERDDIRDLPQKYTHVCVAVDRGGRMNIDLTEKHISRSQKKQASGSFMVEDFNQMVKDIGDKAIRDQIATNVDLADRTETRITFINTFGLAKPKNSLESIFIFRNISTIIQEKEKKANKQKQDKQKGGSKNVKLETRVVNKVWLLPISMYITKQAEMVGDAKGSVIKRILEVIAHMNEKVSTLDELLQSTVVQTFSMLHYRVKKTRSAVHEYMQSWRDNLKKRADKKLKKQADVLLHEQIKFHDNNAFSLGFDEYLTRLEQEVQVLESIKQYFDGDSHFTVTDNPDSGRENKRLGIFIVLNRVVACDKFLALLDVVAKYQTTATETSAADPKFRIKKGADECKPSSEDIVDTKKTVDKSDIPSPDTESSERRRRYAHKLEGIFHERRTRLSRYMGGEIDPRKDDIYDDEDHVHDHIHENKKIQVIRSRRNEDEYDEESSDTTEVERLEEDSDTDENDIVTAQYKDSTFNQDKEEKDVIGGKAYGKGVAKPWFRTGTIVSSLIGSMRLLKKFRAANKKVGDMQIVFSLASSFHKATRKHFEKFRDKGSLLVLAENFQFTQFDWSVPSGITDLQLLKSFHDSLQIKWSFPKFGRQNIFQYVVHYRHIEITSDSTVKGPWLTQSVEAQENMVIITNLEIHTTYQVKIDCVVKKNDPEAPTTRCPETETEKYKTLLMGPPGTPRQVGRTYTSMTIEWTVPWTMKEGAWVEKYFIQYNEPNQNDENIILTKDNQTRYEVKGLLPSKIYAFKVTAIFTIEKSNPSVQSAWLPTKSQDYSCPPSDEWRVLEGVCYEQYKPSDLHMTYTIRQARADCFSRKRATLVMLPGFSDPEDTEVDLVEREYGDLLPLAMTRSPDGGWWWDTGEEVIGEIRTDIANKADREVGEQEEVEEESDGMERVDGSTDACALKSRYGVFQVPCDLTHDKHVCESIAEACNEEE